MRSSNSRGVLAFGVKRHKYEYDSLATIAKQNDMSLSDLKRQLRKKED